jgi:hypothetical protein
LSVTDSTTAPAGSAGFSLAFQNVGSEDALLNLGMRFGRIQEPWAILLALTDADGKTREFQYRSRRVTVIRGRLDDFIVALPGGATYVLKSDLSQLGNYPPLDLKPGRYRLSARYEGKSAQWVNVDTPGIRLWPFWEGTLQSNAVEFQLSTPTRH